MDVEPLLLEVSRATASYAAGKDKPYTKTDNTPIHPSYQVACTYKTTPRVSQPTKTRSWVAVICMGGTYLRKSPRPVGSRSRCLLPTAIWKVAVIAGSTQGSDQLRDGCCRLLPVGHEKIPCHERLGISLSNGGFHQRHRDRTDRDPGREP